MFLKNKNSFSGEEKEREEIGSLTSQSNKQSDSAFPEDLAIPATCQHCGGGGGVKSLGPQARVSQRRRGPTCGFLPSFPTPQSFQSLTKESLHALTTTTHL